MNSKLLDETVDEIISIERYISTIGISSSVRLKLMDLRLKLEREQLRLSEEKCQPSAPPSSQLRSLATTPSQDQNQKKQ